MRDKIGYIVEFNSHCYDSEYSDERYGPWHESWHQDFKSIHRMGPKQYSDVNSDLDIAAGEPVYVVWVEYSGGDSFGWADNKYAIAIGVFKTYEDAEALERNICDRNNEYPRDKEYLLEYHSTDGQIITIYREWEGYFNELRDVHIEGTLMMPPM